MRYQKEVIVVLLFIITLFITTVFIGVSSACTEPSGCKGGYDCNITSQSCLQTCPIHLVDCGNGECVECCTESDCQGYYGCDMITSTCRTECDCGLHDCGWSCSACCTHGDCPGGYACDPFSGECLGTCPSQHQVNSSDGTCTPIPCPSGTVDCGNGECVECCVSSDCQGYYGCDTITSTCRTECDCGLIDCNGVCSDHECCTELDCPGGYACDADTGVCLHTCPLRYYELDGQCIFVPCQDGTFDCGNGQCVECCNASNCQGYYGCDSVTSTCRTECECGLVDCNGACALCCTELDCPGGHECSDDGSLCLDTCPDHYTEIDGQCTLIQCPSGTFDCGNGACVQCCNESNCPGYYGCDSVTSTCRTECECGLVDCNGACTLCCTELDCPGGHVCSEDGSHCLDTCPDHYTEIDGQCTLIQCPSGTFDCGNGACVECCNASNCQGYYGCDGITSTCRTECECGLIDCNDTCSLCCTELDCPGGHVCSDDGSVCLDTCPEHYVDVDGQCILFQCPSGTFDCGNGACVQCCNDSNCPGYYGCDAITSTCRTGCECGLVDCNGACTLCCTELDCPGGHVCSDDGLLCLDTCPEHYVDIDGQCTLIQCPSGTFDCGNGACVQCCNDSNCLGYYGCDSITSTCRTECECGLVDCNDTCTLCCTELDCPGGHMCSDDGSMCLDTCPEHYIDIDGQCTLIQCQTGTFDCGNGQCVECCNASNCQGYYGCDSVTSACRTECECGLLDCDGMCSVCCTEQDCPGGHVCDPSSSGGICLETCPLHYIDIDGQCEIMTCPNNTVNCGNWVCVECCDSSDCPGYYGCDMTTSTCRTQCNCGLLDCNGTCSICCTELDCPGGHVCDQSNGGTCLETCPPDYYDVYGQCTHIPCPNGTVDCGNGACVQCCSSSDCPGYYGCDMATSTCRTECECGLLDCNETCSVCCSNHDCPGDHTCDPSTGTCLETCPDGLVDCNDMCVECCIESDCQGYYGCDTITHTCRTECEIGLVDCDNSSCVECCIDNDCSGYYGCEITTHTCRTECEIGLVDCGNGACVECCNASDCIGYYGCDTTTNTCKKECDSGLVDCNNQQCVECCDSSDCTGYYGCDPATLTCRTECEFGLLDCPDNGMCSVCCTYLDCPGYHACNGTMCLGTCPPGKFEIGGICVNHTLKCNSSRPLNDTTCAPYVCKNNTCSPCISDMDCSDGDQCTKDICNITSGMCTHEERPWECSCHTDLECEKTIKSSECICSYCDRGICRDIRTCDDGDPYTKDICPSNFGCRHTREKPLIKTNISTCTDALFIMERWKKQFRNDTLYTMWVDDDTNRVDGMPSTSTPLMCTEFLSDHHNMSVFITGICSDNNLCTVDSCDDKKCGRCTHSPRNCDDGNECTIDTCVLSTGLCLHQYSDPPTRPVLNNCTEWQCFSHDGLFYTVQKPACMTAKYAVIGGPKEEYPTCDDNNACTVDRYNSATGKCISRLDTCNDFNACTMDYCVESVGCMHVDMNVADDIDGKYMICDKVTGVTSWIPLSSSTTEITSSKASHISRIEVLLSTSVITGLFFLLLAQ